ncbi:hypothetical protein WR25_21545 [Diploscapter pachys]|uniref:Transthyretin/hydroxyisourate hydrolase domain-containing protein n=1 Tax=Diploscapter pachys TaxID=2018661 RepID=A0A2A2JNM0_9BILA|nr:hypothetical protein WR25_21545 [Diploscapter pachys]
MKNTPRLICLLLAAYLPNELLASKYTDSILTKSTAAKGVLRCGKTPLKDAHVWLFRNTTLQDDDILDYVVTGPDGSFSLEGHTGGRPSENMGIKPKLRFFHKCDHTKDSYRAFNFAYNETYTNLGRITRKTFDLGEFNLQLQMPGETTEKKLYEGKPKKFE